MVETCTALALRAELETRLVWLVSIFTRLASVPSAGLVRHRAFFATSTFIVVVLIPWRLLSLSKSDSHGI